MKNYVTPQTKLIILNSWDIIVTSDEFPGGTEENPTQGEGNGG